MEGLEGEHRPRINWQLAALPPGDSGLCYANKPSETVLGQPHVLADLPHLFVHMRIYTQGHTPRQRPLCVSVLAARQQSGYRKAMGVAIAGKIRRLRLERGWNQTDLAERLGVTQATVSRWEKGSVPEARHLSQLAELAGESVKTFIDSGEVEASPAPLLGRFFVRGEVAAGVWATAYEWPQQDWYPYSGVAAVDAPAQARYGLRVAGESMNQVYPPGTILDCISIDHAGELRSGQRVIIERWKIDGEVEATVKEYVLGQDGRVWLVPRSDNPAFQAPICASEPGDGIAEVRIVARVVGSYRPE